jgi:hypothetical protein
MSPRIAGALSRPVQGKRPDDTVAKDIVYIGFAKYPEGETP